MVQAPISMSARHPLRRRTWRWRAFGLGLALWFSAWSAHAVIDVSVVLSAEGDAYATIAERIDDRLRGKQLARVRTLTADAVDRLNRGDAPDLVVAVGLKATQAVLAANLDVPVISTLIPKVAFDQLVRPGRRRGVTAVFLDQPIARQLDLIRLTLPEKKRVGIVLGPQSQATADSLQAEARRRGLQLNVSRVDTESGLFGALEGVLRDSEVLLSLPDPVVSNSNTIPSVLFTAYRFLVPVVGFSPAYVRAGAVTAVFSTPEQLAEQVADAAAAFAGPERQLPPPSYPVYFKVAVNYHVARSLDLVLDREASLAARLGSRSIAP